MKGFLVVLVVCAVLASMGLLVLGYAAMNEFEEFSQGAITRDEIGLVIGSAEDGLGYLFGSALCALIAIALIVTALRMGGESAAKTRLEGLVDRLEGIEERLEALAAPAARARPAGPPEPPEPRRPVPALIADLTDEDVATRREAARALQELGPSAASALPALERALHAEGEDLTVLRAVALAIPALSRDAAGVVVAMLVARLESPEPRVRDWAAVTLGKIGPGAREALEPLAATLDDPILARTAAEAMKRIGGRDAVEMVKRRRASDAV